LVATFFLLTRWTMENPLPEIFVVFLGHGSLPEIRKIDNP
jgi:hypothetical protein